MKLYFILRIISIVCYSFIFLQGSMIVMPVIIVFTLGITDGDPATRLLRILADLALITLAIISFMDKSKVTIALELIIFFLLLSPLIQVLLIFPFRMFASPLFIGPFVGFVILYPLSLLFSYLDYRKPQKSLGLQIDKMDIFK